MEKLLTPRQVRDVLGCRTQVVADLIGMGLLPCIRFGKVKRVRSSALDHFLLAMEGKDVHEVIKEAAGYGA